MQIEYTVHSVNQTDIDTLAHVDGRDLMVKAPGLVVEMVSTDGRMGHTFSFLPTDMDAALALYVVGATVISTHSAAPSAVA